MSLHRVPNADKGARYLGLLDHALCHGQWSDVPELARKVEKHAPQRKSLTLAARAECHVVTASHRPTSASSATTTSIHGLTELLPRLREAVTTAESTHPDDATIASTCLAGIYWLQEAPLEALKVLDAGAGQSSAGPAGNSTLGWLEVCQVKAAYIHASCMEASGRQSEAREYYHAAVLRTPGYRSPELRKWTERLLAQACLYSVKTIPSPSTQDLGETYTAFKAWGEFWERIPSKEETTTSGQDIPRRQVWKAYYDLLSTILQRGLVFNPDAQSSEDLFILPLNTSTNQHTHLKLRQRSEMQRVESTHESLLLAEIKFPKASQASTEVEAWAQQVMANWKVYSGSAWTDADLGDGGKTGVSRSVLDILYRAATKSFHSTPILRHLFTVHAALGEFDLALHAFESYLEIVDKGKARAEKTGQLQFGLDDDDTAMLTAAEAVRVLCRYGDREHVERAVTVSGSMQKWLDHKRPATADSTTSASSLLQKTTLAANYRALGISQAHWAQLTYESEERSRLLTEASNHLMRAQRYDPANIDTAYALALVLAETRDVSGAIEVIRGVIEPEESPVVLTAGLAPISPLERKRQLIPLWHLLALCLTAQDDFEAAEQMCQAAYKQFGNPMVLFGQPMETMLRDPEKATVKQRGLIDHMEGLEKESILQIKMTEIMLLELTEGAETAVDLADELLGLYSRLFGSPDNKVSIMKPTATSAVPPPSRLGGTLRSIAGSIRPRSRRRSNATGTVRAQSVDSEAAGTSSPASRELADRTNEQPAAPPPISITVPDDSPASAEKSHGHHLHLPHIPHHPFGGRNHGGDVAADSRSASDAGGSEGVEERSTPSRSQVQPSLNTGQPMGEIPHNEPHNELPPPPGHVEQPPTQDVRLPTAHPASKSVVPETQLLPMHERRHRFGVLVRTWLFIAGLYIRAEMYDDSETAVQNAAKFVDMLEIELAGSDSGTNARRLFHKGWGGGDSIDALWADVWSTKAHLALAREHPFEAMAQYEQALSHFPDHPAGIIGISNLLMDIYEEKLPAEEPIVPLRPLPTAPIALLGDAKPTVSRPTSSASTVPSRRPSLVSDVPDVETTIQNPTPAELNRLAARDRAYMLLANLTKLGAGWDDSEAWLTFARAHELGGEIGKAKEALWWVVELEDWRPVRRWRDVTAGVYAL
ncbi:uncharacterized protein RCC_07760 [Ramularia collo-cygni]|uniref:Filamentation protein n=1 Tax=Ramularia collo-cygni TaxID=112498 RepID=A0A2D3VG48_9PEZI|nr:uncharacterized protein RCC_07760 [Ramularia collo-cygni]CZT21894.1 uncharacterized protein RCC_07760 [Ramularia collo-cygni]